MSSDIDVLKLEMRPFIKRSVTTADGATPANNTLIDNTLSEPDDFWNDMCILIRTGACAGELRRILDYDLGTTTLTVNVAFSAQIVAGVQYVMQCPGQDPFLVDIEAKLDALPNIEHETEWATSAKCDQVESVAETNLTADPIVVTFPVGSTRVRAILVASIHILNLDANTHHIAFKVQGDRDGGGYVDQLDLSASAQLGLTAVDASPDAWCGAIDVTTLVNTSGSTYSFRFVVTSDNAGIVRYITCFTLVLVYTM